MPKILVVEDEPSAQMLFKIMLDRCGAELLLADTTAGAKATLARHDDIDLVMLDGSLKGVDKGHDVAAFIVDELWSQQSKAGRVLTPFVTISSHPFAPVGVSAVFEKHDMFQTLTQLGVAKGFESWLETMKATVPSRPATQGISPVNTKPTGP